MVRKMKILKPLLTIRIKNAVILLGLLCIIYYVCSTIYYVTTNTIVFPSQRSIQKILTDDNQLDFQDHLNVRKALTPTGFKMIYSDLCPFQVASVPKTDIQMLDVYKNFEFPNGMEKEWNITVNPNKWNKQHKLKVFVVLHSHNDPGWIYTFDDYYRTRTKHILNAMLQKLPEDSRRKFIWAEISFFSKWWNDLKQEDQEIVKTLVHNNQLEFVTGGWVMNDEASTHWISITHQITEGHKWLKLHLNYTPTNHWSIDPFGLSATQPMLLKQMGLKNMVIQRAHYAIKKHFGKTKNLEFRWKQLWDNTGETEIFTQLMPYISYDISHSCGPNPEICHQFNFKRPSFSWPWSWLFKDVLLEPITRVNVKQKYVAELLLDQLRKKSMLFRTDVLLVPLGNDFTYVKPIDFDDQFQNYEKLFDFMNSNPHMHTEIQFGTLSDYFNAVHSEKKSDQFPTLTGDFFTYAHHSHYYWSGYFTSRPFYKRMERELLSYIRAAEIILTLVHMNRKPSFKLTMGDEAHLFSLLADAQKALALFQHHDAITGTSRKRVVVDYGKRMLQAIEGTKNIIQQCTNLLLLAPWADVRATDTILYKVDDIRYSHDSLPEQHTITIAPDSSKKVVLLNSLPHSRHEMVRFIVATPFVEVKNFKGRRIKCHISPIFEYESRMSNSKYAVSFVADVPALGLITYTINALLEDEVPPLTVPSSITIFNQHDDVVAPPGFPKMHVRSSASEFTIQNDHIIAAFSSLGLLKSLNVDGNTIPVNLNFVKYGSENVEKSGAYLFLPDGDANPIQIENTTVKVIEGPLLSSVIIELPYVKHTVTLFNTPGADNLGIEIQNIVNISHTRNFEIVMRLSTNINNTDDFFTDLNGYQIIRRKYFSKLPLQANYYPMSSMAYLEDETTRITLLTAAPVGCASLCEGQIEVMLDRKLNQDDHLGLGYGIIDNHPTKHIFKVILEKKIRKCKVTADNHPAGFPSLSAYVMSQSLLNPLIRMLKIDNHDQGTLNIYSPVKMEFGVDFLLASLRNDVVVDRRYYIGIVLQRQYLDVCFANKALLQRFPLSQGSVNISTVLPELEQDVEFSKSSLSFLQINEQIDFRSDIALCPMDMQAFVLYK